MEYDSALKVREMLTLATMWMDLEDFMFSEVRQTQKCKYHMISLV